MLVRSGLTKSNHWTEADTNLRQDTEWSDPKRLAQLRRWLALRRDPDHARPLVVIIGII